MAKRKIAVVGTSPTSRDHAPYSDPDWEIWMCGPANIGMPRFDRWYEAHKPCPERYQYKTARLEEDQSKVFLLTPWELLPDANMLDRGSIGKDFGPYVNAFFTSTLAYMMAEAINEKVAEIGIWGVDMAHETEYERQRPGMYFFMNEAVKRGIDVHVAAGSPLRRVPNPYPVNHEGDEAVWFKTRIDLQEQQLRNLEERRRTLELQEAEAKGTLDGFRHARNSWA